MAMIATGVVLWMLIHLTPAVAPGLRQSLLAGLGKNPYKGVFSLSILLSLVLIIVGWRGTVPESVYLPPIWGGKAAIVLMALSVFLFGAANYPSAVKRYLRNPMLTGLIVWSLAHLLANGDNRSLLLFGGLGLWALLEIPLINRRGDDWVKPEAPPLAREIRGALISVVIFVLLIFLHPYFAGVSPIQR